jgi:hypothetical protein
MFIITHLEEIKWYKQLMPITCEYTNKRDMLTHHVIQPPKGMEQG